MRHGVHFELKLGMISPSQIKYQILSLHRMPTFCVVTFPSGKLYIGSILALFFDNKLDFSGIKLAES